MSWPRRGDRITVIVETLPQPPIVARGIVRSRNGGRITYDVVSAAAQPGWTLTVAATARGLLWARGWDTPEANALRTTAALR